MSTPPPSLSIRSSDDFPAKVALPNDVARRRLQARDWCEEKLGPEWVGRCPNRVRGRWAYGEEPSKENSALTTATFYFASTDAAFEFKLRWG